MSLAGFISKMVTSITKTTFQFNKTLDVLIEQFKDSCPTYPELLKLIEQKNQINGALEQVEQKILLLNKVASGSEVAVKALSAGKTLIKQLPIPTSFPPGIGIPVSIINNFSDALDSLGTLIDKEEASLDAIPEALELISNDVGEVITKLNEFTVVLDECLANDPAVTQDDLDNIDADATNFVGLITNEDLNKLLNEPPGLLYGDYYLRKQILPNPDEFSFNKKQITAQNKESVLPPNEFYNLNSPVEMLYGDESFSSSNIVLVEEMKWLIDTKDLIFPPPAPAVDPLKAIQKSSQIAILVAIYGATVAEAEELYESAWELSQGRGPNIGYYDRLVEEAFDNSRTVLEQAVANEGYEFKQGDRILNSTIKTLFLADYADTVNEEMLNASISQIKFQARALQIETDDLGESYDPISKTWYNTTAIEDSLNSRLDPYMQRLAITANFDNLENEFTQLKPEMVRRKPLLQAVFEVVNYMYLAGRPYNFQDPLKDYFEFKNLGYNTPIINGQPINGDNNQTITNSELEDLWISEQQIAELYFVNNRDGTAEVGSTPNGVTLNNLRAYAKTLLFLKLKDALGITWYNANAQASSDQPFWSKGYFQNTATDYANDVNYFSTNVGYVSLDENDPWYFAFGRNGLPIPRPTGG
tara:strand:- start:118 stop:2052 length:1935 start_codon:yes stop_codon:yes gene_type:complete